MTRGLVRLPNSTAPGTLRGSKPWPPRWADSTAARDSTVLADGTAAPDSTALTDSTAMPYHPRKDDAPDARFRRAFWRAFLVADSIRLRQWERSHVTLPQLRVLYH